MLLSIAPPMLPLFFPLLLCRMAFLVACIYMGNMLLPQPLLLRTEMRALLTTICVAFSLASSLTGLRLDWTEAVMRPLLFVA